MKRRCRFGKIHYIHIYTWFILAGSLGALIHADRLRERLPSSVKTLHLLVDGGLFVDVADINSDHTMGNMLRDFFYFHHAHSKEHFVFVLEFSVTASQKMPTLVFLPQPRLHQVLGKHSLQFYLSDTAVT